MSEKLFLQFLIVKPTMKVYMSPDYPPLTLYLPYPQENGEQWALARVHRSRRAELSKVELGGGG